jgi:SNF2 family DNA or RNA helicase
LKRTKTAEADTVQRSIARSHQLKGKLDEIFIKRTKEEVLGDELPEKEETVIFCELTEIQKRLYEYVLTLPDFELLKYAHAPCDCGVNRSIFMGYKRLRDNKERVAYLRRHRDDVTKRKDCCYKTPLNPFRDEEGQPFIHPMAPLWMSQHEDDEECKQCPFCIMFPALNKLYKLASHSCLIQAEHDPNGLDVGTHAWNAAIKDVEFAKVAIPPDILSQLPGGSYIMQDGIMNDHAKLSGKMQKLEKLLKIFSAGNNRVLLFSHWTKTLDVIQQFVQARGYSFIRLDGSTSQQKRQLLVDRFQKDKTIFIFLISTKAGGLGLNLTGTYDVVCVFSCPIYNGVAN